MQINKKEIKEKIGSLLVAARKRVKMTQQEFADKIGVSRSTVANWESGSRSFEFEDIPVIADALGIEPVYFLGYIEEHNDNIGHLESFSDELQEKLLLMPEKEREVTSSTVKLLMNEHFNYEQLQFIYDFVNGLSSFTQKESDNGN